MSRVAGERVLNQHQNDLHGARLGLHDRYPNYPKGENPVGQMYASLAVPSQETQSKLALQPKPSTKSTFGNPQAEAVHYSYDKVETSETIGVPQPVRLVTFSDINSDTLDPLGGVAVGAVAVVRSRKARRIVQNVFTWGGVAALALSQSGCVSESGANPVDGNSNSSTSTLPATIESGDSDFETTATSENVEPSFTLIERRYVEDNGNQRPVLNVPFTTDNIGIDMYAETTTVFGVNLDADPEQEAYFIQTLEHELENVLVYKDGDGYSAVFLSQDRGGSMGGEYVSYVDGSGKEYFRAELANGDESWSMYVKDSSGKYVLVGQPTDLELRELDVATDTVKPLIFSSAKAISPTPETDAVATAVPTVTPTETPSPTATPEPTATLTPEPTVTPNPWQEVSSEIRNEIVEAMPPLFSTTPDVTTDLSQITFVQNGANVNGLDSTGRVVLWGEGWSSAEGADNMQWFMLGEEAQSTIAPLRIVNEMWNFDDEVNPTGFRNIQTGALEPSGPVWMMGGNLDTPLSQRAWDWDFSPSGPGLADTLEPDEMGLQTFGQITEMLYLKFGQAILAQEGTNVSLAEMKSAINSGTTLEVPIQTQNGIVMWDINNGIEIRYEAVSPEPGHSGMFSKFGVESGKLIVRLALESNNLFVDDNESRDNGIVLLNLMQNSAFEYFYYGSNYSLDAYNEHFDDIWRLTMQITTDANGRVVYSPLVSDVARPR